MERKHGSQHLQKCRAAAGKTRLKWTLNVLQSNSDIFNLFFITGEKKTKNKKHHNFTYLMSLQKMYFLPPLIT